MSHLLRGQSAGVSWSHRLAIALLCSHFIGCTLQRYEPIPVEPLQLDIPSTINDERIRAAVIRVSGDAGHWPPAAWDLSMLVAAALAVHPSLATGRARIEAARAGTIAAGVRPNPVLRLPVEYHSRKEDDDDNRVGGGIGLSWVVQARGTRAAAMAAATAEREATEYDLRERAWRLRQDVRNAWLQLVFAKQRLNVLTDASRLAGEQSALTAARVDAGEAGGFEFAQARLMAQKVELRAIEQRVTLATARSNLARAMGLQSAALVDTELAPPGSPAVDLRAIASPADMQRVALTERPDILAALSRYAAAEARLEGEIAKQMPDIRLSPSWFYEQGDNIWALAAGLPIPVLNMNEGAIAVARAERSLAAAQFSELQTRVVTTLQSARARYDALAEAMIQALALERAAAEAESALIRQAEVGYVDRLPILQAAQVRADASMQVVDINAALYAALGELENAIRRPLDGSVFGNVIEVDAIQ